MDGRPIDESDHENAMRARFVNEQGYKAEECFNYFFSIGSSLISDQLGALITFAHQL